MKLNSLSIFFPTLNDSKIIPYLVAKSYEIAPKVAKKFEVIIINDGSTDNTTETLKILNKQYKYFKFYNHKRNLGYGAALKSGFEKAKNEWIFYTDGDGQYDPSELKLLIKKVNKNIDVVNGYKKQREDNIVRKIIGGFYNYSLHKIYRNLPVKDVDCDFRLIRKSVIDKIELNAVSGMVCFELVLKLKKAGARFTQVEVTHYKRPFGHSYAARPKNIIKSILDNVRFYFKEESKI